jgi:DNA repair exonuclease SbcCD ATPase subunit
MSDNAEFEKLSTLEGRLAAALDRIAVGLGEAQAAPQPEDPGITSGAFEDALIRAETAETRAAELEARLAEVETQLAAQSGAADDRDTHSLVTALEAKVESLTARLAARDAEVAALQAEVSAAAAQAADPAQAEQIERLTTQVADLEARVTRLRAERAEAIAERDEARDIAEELQAAGGMGPDDRNMALRAEVQELRAINERLTKNVSRLRGENAADPTILNKALVVELDALKAARASEAAELERILADLDRAGAGEGAHA